ncbi:hypothetical protein SSX86_032327 [Deinandra increscens subsp. villosa]|uniref:DUF1677 family protein n=1 Tax=Deinandra increscens subsp. villosa TaxID=3103831 RepID=A0AAP0GGW8_9ASTR
MRERTALAYAEIAPTVTDETVVISATDSQMNAAVNSTESEFAKCDCCGLTEECTPTYVEKIRERYHGNWICGLCGEAVKDEIVRSERLINTEEALTRHMNFCRKSTSASDPVQNPAVNLITAMRQILRRSLDSPRRTLRSAPSSPLRSTSSVRLSRSETDLQEMMK